MGVNLLLICVGLIICCGGIYFKKICAGIMGLAWGSLVGMIIAILRIISSGNIWVLLYGSSEEERSSTIIIIIAAITISALSVWLDKICVAINTFLSSFFVVLMIACLFAEDIDELSGIIIISLMLSGGLAIAAYIYDQYAFILVTAFSGAFIASLGGTGLINNIDLSEVLYVLFLDDENTKFAFLIIAATIILGCVGFRVQVRRRQTADVNSCNTVNAGVEGKNIHPDRLNLAVEKVVNGAKRVGEAANPCLSGMGDRFKGTWDELRIEQGRNNLKDAIVFYKMLFIAPSIAFLLVPIIYRTMTYNENLYEIVSWISMISAAVSVGVLSYVVLTKDARFNIVYQLPYLVGYVVFNFTSFQYYTTFSAVIYLLTNVLKFLITWYALYIVARFVKRDEMKPLILTIAAFVIYYFIMDFIMDWIAGFYISLNGYTIIELAICIAGGYMAFKKYHGINIFDFNEGGK